MCSRLCLCTNIGQIGSRFGIAEGQPLLRPHWNINAGHLLPVVRPDPLLQWRRLDLMRWGLIPASAKSAVIVRSNLGIWQADGSLNPMLLHSRQRCLVPVDNFYEWRMADGQPFAVALASRQLMALAGLWNTWTSPLGEQIGCFAILTTDPSNLLAPLCKQMPIIIAPEDWNFWLGEEPARNRSLLDVLKSCPDELLTVWPVSRRVCNAKNDDPQVLEAVTAS